MFPEQFLHLHELFPYVQLADPLLLGITVHGCDLLAAHVHNLPENHVHQDFKSLHSCAVFCEGQALDILLPSLIFVRMILRICPITL